MRNWKLHLLPAIALLACTLCLHAAPAPKPVPVLLDTDIGTDIDDAFAVALILHSPELDLRAVTTASGDTEARARLVAKMLWVDGRHNVPVAAGVPGSKLDIAQTRWADGFTSPSLLKEPAVALMKSTIDQAHGKLVLIAIGPLTNVAALLRQYPGEKKKIREIVLMGGSIARGYAPGSGPAAEYNIAADAPAAQVVFSSGIPILMAPLDVTAQLQLDAANRQRIFAQGHASHRCAAGRLSVMGTAHAHFVRSHGRRPVPRSAAMHHQTPGHPGRRPRHDARRAGQAGQYCGRRRDRPCAFLRFLHAPRCTLTSDRPLAQVDRAFHGNGQDGPRSAVLDQVQQQREPDPQNGERHPEMTVGQNRSQRCLHGCPQYTGFLPPQFLTTFSPPPCIA